MTRARTLGRLRPSPVGESKGESLTSVLGIPSRDKRNERRRRQSKDRSASSDPDAVPNKTDSAPVAVKRSKVYIWLLGITIVIGGQ